MRKPGAALVELVASAISLAECQDQCFWKDYKKAAKAAILAARGRK